MTNLSPVERFEIAELLARRYRYADYGDLEAPAGCYTADVTIDIAGAGVFTGVDWQVEHARESFETTGGQNRHVITNLFVEATGADAAIAHYFLINLVSGRRVGEPRVRTTGTFADHVVRREHGWLINRREFTPDQPFKLDG